MNAKEKAAMLAEAEETLEMLEGTFDDFLRDGDRRLAWNARTQYDGAVLMLERLGLISAEDKRARSDALFERYMAGPCPKEAV